MSKMRCSVLLNLFVVFFYLNLMSVIFDANFINIKHSKDSYNKHGIWRAAKNHILLRLDFKCSSSCSEDPVIE